MSWEALGGDPAPGRPAAFAEIARDFFEAARIAGDVYTSLSHLAASVDDSIWQGEGADAFQGELGTFPSRLKRLPDSYETAAEALDVYGRVLAELQEKARTLLHGAETAREEEAARTQRRDQTRTQGPGAPTITHDEAISGTRDRLWSIHQELDRIREERLAAEGRLVSRLEGAQDPGIRNDSWLKRTGDAIHEWVDEHADLIRGISNVLKVASAIAGTLSFIPALTPIFGPIAFGAATLAFGLDAVLVASGNGDWKALAMDAAFMALPAAGRLASRAAMTSQAGRAVTAHHLEVRGLEVSRRMRPSTVAALRTRNFGPNVFRGASRPQVDLHPQLQQALDRVPMEVRDLHFHGKCAEIKAINEALDERARLNDSVVQTRQVRSPGHPRDGLPHEPCGSCEHVLRELGIRYRAT